MASYLLSMPLLPLKLLLVFRFSTEYWNIQRWLDRAHVTYFTPS